MALPNTAWQRLQELPVTVDAWRFEPVVAPPGSGQDRVTTRLRLSGGGCDGLGEDVSPMRNGVDALHHTAPRCTIDGGWALAELLDRLATIEQWLVPPRSPALRVWRNWAFTSAALDLALAQAELSLGDVLGLTPRPVRFVNSLSLGAPPSLEPVLQRLERYPGLRLKVDAVPGWSEGLAKDLAATGAVDVVDFKGWYSGPEPPVSKLLGMYELVVEVFPDAVLEDPHDLPEVTALLVGRDAPVSYDARVSSWASLDRFPLPVGAVNVKPSRFDGLSALLDFYFAAEAAGLPLYGGGMDELDVGRGQIQILASLLHPDGPNDVAPVGYNHLVPPTGLPDSPLHVSPAPAGFRTA